MITPSNPRNISFAFALIITLLISTGGIAITYLNSIAADTASLYHHPYTVTNAARNIKINLISMHRYMKDVVLADDDTQLKQATSLVDHHEQLVLQDFDLVFERYLGKHSDIQSAYTAFIDWKKIRDEVIFLKISGQDKEAAFITKNKGAEHVTKLNNETQRLIDFADNKAKTFLNNATNSKENALLAVYVLLSITVFASILVSLNSVRRLKSSQKEIMTRMHLIDQNIMITKADTEGRVTHVSSSLCRFLGRPKRELIGKELFFFASKNNNNIDSEHIFEITSSGTTWEDDLCIKTTKGEVRWVHSTIHPELNEQHQVCGYSNIIQDISDRKLIEKISITDSLTQLYNRRHFDEILESEIKLAQRNNNNITLAIIDIDHFKDYNDEHGHPQGDSALATVAKTIKASLKRPNDYAFRIGGEEFALICSGQTPQQAFDFLESLRLAVESLKIDHKHNSASPYITISIGARVELARQVVNQKQLYSSADSALYQAKKTRNQVLVPSSSKIYQPNIEMKLAK